MKNTQIITELNKIKNPYSGKNIELNETNSNLQIDADKIIFEYKQFGDDEDINRQIQREMLRKLKVDLKYKYVKISIIEDETPKEEEVQKMISENTRVIAVMSGKGGVGKSQVTFNLAKTLTNQGKKVGIIDADIYGYSIPKILDIYGEPEILGNYINPLRSKEGIQVMSTQYFIENNENKAIVWRAPMLSKMMNHFFNDVVWSEELDYLFIDMPPGTGDITLNLTQFVEELETVIVTTANPDAAHVALRSGQLANDLNIQIIGIIENMSYYIHNDEQLHIFGSGGAQIVAEELNVPVLGSIKIDANQENLVSDYKKIVKKIKGE